MEVVNTQSATIDPTYFYNSINSILMNPIILLILIIIVCYVLFFAGLGDELSEGEDSFHYGKLFGILFFILLVFIAVINGLQYFFSINISAYINGLFSPTTKLDIVVNESTPPLPTIRFKNQVFNIPGNQYTYTNAKALCAAYGAKLATYPQIEDAYQKGGEWCNYGWSDGQMALFPTQEKTFQHLQTIPGHEHDCGRPGINGGYISNPNIRFGVNCYGHKPKMTNEEEELMENTTPYPKTAKDIAFQKMVDYWKTQLQTILVSPFNYKDWGQWRI
jgi:hypothetical protein